MLIDILCHGGNLSDARDASISSYASNISTD